MGLFGQAKDLYRLQKQAKKIKEDLKKLQIEAESEGVVLVINGEQEIVEIRIPEGILKPENRSQMEKTLMSVFNKAIKKSQEVAAEKMRDMMKETGLDFPGLGGASA